LEGLATSTDKFADFEIISRSQSLPSVVSDRAQLDSVSVGLLKNLMLMSKAVRLLGVSLSALQGDADSDASQLVFSLLI
jgi:DNA polymerase IV